MQENGEIAMFKAGTAHVYFLWLGILMQTKSSRIILIQAMRGESQSITMIAICLFNQILHDKKQTSIQIKKKTVQTRFRYIHCDYLILSVY